MFMHKNCYSLYWQCVDWEEVEDDDFSEPIITEHLGDYKTKKYLLKKVFDELRIIDSRFFPDKVKISTSVKCADITIWLRKT